MLKLFHFNRKCAITYFGTYDYTRSLTKVLVEIVWPVLSLCHFMKTLWHGSALGYGGLLSPKARCYIRVSLNTLLKKQSSFRWFETQWTTYETTEMSRLDCRMTRSKGAGPSDLQWRHNELDDVSIVYSGAGQRKHQSSASLAFVCGEFTGDRWIPRTNGQ